MKQLIKSIIRRKIILGLLLSCYLLNISSNEVIAAVDHNRIIFLHHSVGRITYAYDVSDPYDEFVDSDCGSSCACDGLARWFCQYNQSHSQNFEIKEVEWPCGHGQNDPQVYQDIFVGSSCSRACQKPGSDATRNEIGNVCSIGDLTNFEVIVFKTCYTESGIDSATQQRYQNNYESMATEFVKYPNKIFILWNLFPNINGTSYDRQFSQWLKNTFAPRYQNVYVWDVFEYMTCGSNNTFISSYRWGDNHPKPEAGQLLALGGINICGETVVGLGPFIVQSVLDFENQAPPSPSPSASPSLSPTPTRSPSPSITPSPDSLPSIKEILLNWLKQNLNQLDLYQDGKINALDLAVLILRLSPSPTPSPSPQSSPTPSGTIWRPFTPDSPWNTPIGSNPEIDPNSNTYINQVNNICPNCPVATVAYDWGVGVYYVENLNPYPSQIMVRSHTDWGHSLSAPVPRWAKQDPSSDGHLLIIDRRLQREWGFWAVRGTYPNLTAGTGDPMDLSGSGVRSPGQSGPREAGYPLSAGLIRVEEMKAGQLRHALVFANDGRNGWSNFVSPASTGCDYGLGPNGNHVIPMGTRLQLKPEVNISGLTPKAQIIARALKEYGMYLGDENDARSLGIYMQTVGDEDGNGVVEYWSDLWRGLWADSDRSSLSTLHASDFRVIKLPPIGGANP